MEKPVTDARTLAPGIDNTPRVRAAHFAWDNLIQEGLTWLPGPKLKINVPKDSWRRRLYACVRSDLPHLTSQQTPAYQGFISFRLAGSEVLRLPFDRSPGLLGVGGKALGIQFGHEAWTVAGTAAQLFCEDMMTVTTNFPGAGLAALAHPIAPYHIEVAADCIELVIEANTNVGLAGVNVLHVLGCLSQGES